jgi:hypothetical protein
MSWRKKFAILLGIVLFLVLVTVITNHWSPSHVGSSDLYPNPRLTPGHVDPQMTADKVCQPGFAQQDRIVTEAMRRKVFEAYGIPLDQTHDAQGNALYEINQFVPVIMGGDSPPDDPTANLWPQRYSPKPGAYEKDTVEKYLRDAVCKHHTMTLKQAQDAIMGDWYKIYLEWQSKPHRHRHSP